jgi:inner membrane protein
MQGYNHVVGGIAFTGIFASFADVNIFAQEELLAATWTFSILPDIDHNRSLIGKALYPVSNYLHRNFGHRTLTHSIFFYFGSIAIISGIEHIFHNSSTYTIIFALAYLSHIIFDMCTKAGVPIFYPFSKRPAVLPANPDFRLSSSDFRAEAIIFIVFCVLIFLCQPLFENGFWTTYNKAFLTGEHVEREFKKSKDLLWVQYQKSNSNPDSGYLVQINSENEMIFFRQKFNRVTPDETKFIDFNHSGNTIKIEQRSLFQTDVDTVRKLLELPMLKIQIQSQNAVLKWFDGAIMKTGNQAEVEFTKDFQFFTENPSQDTQAQKQLEVLTAEINKRRAEQEEQIREVKEVESWIDQSNERLESTNTSDYEKTRIIERQKEWRNKLGQLRERPKITTNIQEAELISIQKQLNQKPTISANLIILKIQNNEIKRSNQEKNNTSQLPSIARQ